MGALNKDEKEAMLNSGFLKYEVEAFDNAKTPTGETQLVAYNSVSWQNMMSSRREYVMGCHSAGLTNKQIRDLVKHHYETSKERTPWDFLKLEYQPTDRNLTDTEFADKLGIRAAVTRNLVRPAKVDYGPIMDSEFRPRTVPKSTVPRPTYKPLLPVHKRTAKPVAAPEKKRRFRI